MTSLSVKFSPIRALIRLRSFRSALVGSTRACQSSRLRAGTRKLCVSEHRALQLALVDAAAAVFFAPARPGLTASPVF